MLQVMAGPHPFDQFSCEMPPARYAEQLNGWTKSKRIALSLDLGHAKVDPEVKDLVLAAAKVFQDDLGATVTEIVPEWGKAGPELIRFFWSAHETANAKYLSRWRDKMDPGLVACIEAAMQYSVMDYQRMRERKRDYCAAIHQTFEVWDYLITPTASVAAFPAHLLQPPSWPQHEWDWFSWAEFTYPFNFAANPAAAIPCGFTRNGLPVGFQIVGRRFDDLGVLQASAAFERVRPWQQNRPPLH
jgi:aspartyl-tRNA(Asn)/glutamyl-tRNA(Gln) amidotransferase subunit A